MATVAEHPETDSIPRPRDPEPAPQTGDPGPLGMAAFALTTFVLSVFNAGLLDTGLQAVVLPLALFYGGITQVLAGMWAFRSGNTFGALAFTSFGAFWLSYAAYSQFVLEGLGAAAASATGVFLLGWTIFSAYMTLAAMRTNAAVLAVFVALTLTLVLLTSASFTGSTALTYAGGWAGLATAFLAWYGSAAVIVNLTWNRAVLPVGPLA
ncbi:acetate uptake transporter [Parasphingorhabdus pacifica]